jgi:hypothetical protein
MQEMGGSLQLVVDSSRTIASSKSSNGSINNERRRQQLCNDGTVMSQAKSSDLLDGTVMKFVLYRKPTFMSDESRR